MPAKKREAEVREPQLNPAQQNTLGRKTGETLLLEMRFPKPIERSLPTDRELVEGILTRDKLDFQSESMEMFTDGATRKVSRPVALSQLSLGQLSANAVGLLAFCPADGNIGSTALSDLDHEDPWAHFRDKQQALLNYLNDGENAEFAKSFLEAEVILHDGTKKQISDYFARDPLHSHKLCLDRTEQANMLLNQIYLELQPPPNNKKVKYCIKKETGEVINGEIHFSKEIKKLVDLSDNDLAALKLKISTDVLEKNSLQPTTQDPIKGRKLFFREAYNDIDNLLLMCHACNLRKKDQAWQDWFRKQEPFLGEAFITAVEKAGGFHEGIVLQKICPDKKNVGDSEVEVSSVVIGGTECLLHCDFGDAERVQVKGVGQFVREWFEKTNTEYTKELAEAYVGVWLELKSIFEERLSAAAKLNAAVKAATLAESSQAAALQDQQKVDEEKVASTKRVSEKLTDTLRAHIQEVESIYELKSEGAAPKAEGHASDSRSDSSGEGKDRIFSVKVKIKEVFNYMHLTKQAKDFVRQKFPHLSDSDKNQLLDDFKELKIPVREDGIAALTAIQVSLSDIATTTPSAAQIKERLIKTKEAHVKSGLTEAQVKENSRMLEKSEAARQAAEKRADAEAAARQAAEAELAQTKKELEELRRLNAARKAGSEAATEKQPVVPLPDQKTAGLLDVAEVSRLQTSTEQSNAAPTPPRPLSPHH